MTIVRFRARTLTHTQQQIHITTCEQLAAIDPIVVSNAIGDVNEAERLCAVARGVDTDAVVESEVKPSTISADSFARDLDSSSNFYVFLGATCELLAARLLDDVAQHSRVATSLTVRARFTISE